MTNKPACTLCRLHESCQTVRLMGVGPANAKAMIIGEAPGREEDEEGEPFIGRSGQLLDSVLQEVGLKRDDIYVTNAVHCRPPDNRTPTKAEIKRCRVWLQKEIERVQPKVVLLLGNVPLLSVLDLTGVKKLRGQPIERDGITYLPTFHPAYILRDERERPKLKSDLAKFKAMIAGGGMPRVSGLNVRIVVTRRDIAEMMEDIAESPRVSFDLETSSLSPWHGYIVSIGIGTATTQWVIFKQHKNDPKYNLKPTLIDDIVAEITDLNPTFVGQNIKFDSLWMRVHFGVKWYGAMDTMLADYILDENKKHGLDVIASERYGAIDWDVPLSDKHGLTGTAPSHARYLGLDLFYTYQAAIDLRKDLDQQPGIAKVFDELLMPAARMFVDVEYRGVYVDLDKFDEAGKYLREQIAMAEEKLNRVMPGVNWGSTKQVSKVLFQDLKLKPLDMTAKNAPSTSESVLKRLASEHEVPALLLKYRAAKQQLSFFIDGWWPRLHKHRMHPSFKLHGTVTGRLSCEDPNLQQVPRDPRIRQLITAPPGWVLVEADLSQIELRLLAELSRDPELTKAFLTGVDVHWLTALRELFRGGGYREQVIQTALAISRRNSVEYEDCYDILLEAGPDAAAKHGPPPSDGFPGWKEIRKRAKAINFGYAYGMWWKKFIEYARDNYDVHVTEKQAQESRISYFDLYRTLPTWHNKQRDFAHRHGYVRSLLGRKRRLPRAMDANDTPERGSAQRQAINSPVQSFASDWNVAAGLELVDMHSPTYFHLVGTVHDALLMEVRLDKLEEVVPDILRVMQWPKLMDSFGINMRIPIESDCKIGAWSKGKTPEEYFGEEIWQRISPRAKLGWHKDQSQPVVTEAVEEVSSRVPLQIRRKPTAQKVHSPANLRQARASYDRVSRRG